MVLTPGAEGHHVIKLLPPEQFWETLLLAATQLSSYLWILDLIP